MQTKFFLNEFFRKRINESDLDYQKNFQLAKKNNKKFGLEIPEFFIDETFSFDKDLIAQFIHDTIFKRTINEIACNCFPVCQELSGLLKSELNIESIPTIGYVIVNNTSQKRKRIFYEHKYFLKKRMDRNDNESLNLHCWLTLPNFCIIDPTIYSSKLVVQKKMESEFRFSYMLETKIQNLNDEYNYQPILLGNEYVGRLSLKGKRIQIEY